MKSAIIYSITNLKNKNCYIGSTTNFNRRKKDHLKQLSENKHHSLYLQRAWNKHGKSNFIIEIIESFNYLEKQDILDKEQFYIDTFNSAYNMCKVAGSQLGSKRSKEFKENCRRRMIGNIPWNKDKKNIYSDEYKRKIGEKSKLKKLSDSHKKALVAKSKKPIKFINKQGEVFIFDSITNCAKELNTTFILIWYNLSGRTKNTKYGKFEYI